LDIKGKVALVTGGGSGIGAAIAKALAAEGARVMIAGRRPEQLRQTVQAIGELGGDAAIHVGDVARAQDCEALVAATEAQFGPVDVLVNNAGILPKGKPLTDYSVEEWDAVMSVNVRAAFLLAKRVLPRMVERGSGHIVNISSVSGIRFFVGESIYGLSKHALNALTNFISEEYGARGIHCLSICPGLVHTDMGLTLEPTHRDRLLTPEDIAGSVIWALRQRHGVRVPFPIVLEPQDNPWEGGYPMLNQKF